MREHRRRNIRNMSQRRKGPGGPPHQQHNSFPAPVPSLIPRTRADFLPFPPKHEIFLRLRGTAPGPVLVSALPFRLSYLPAFFSSLRRELESRRGPAGSSAPPVLPLTLHLVQCLRGCSMFYVFLNQDGKAMAPSPSQQRFSEPPPPPGSSTSTPKIFFLTQTRSQFVPCPLPQPARSKRGRRVL